ncbi:MAG: hypothetical protein OEV00_13200, partial [Acidobacteriota bacterium]|nr:hypothetical protein [Acidobacteriota bacterium]
MTPLSGTARRFARVALFLCTVFLVVGCSPQPVTAPSDFDADSLEVVEDLAESLANDLLALS